MEEDANVPAVALSSTSTPAPVSLAADVEEVAAYVPANIKSAIIRSSKVTPTIEDEIDVDDDANDIDINASIDLGSKDSTDDGEDEEEESEEEDVIINTRTRNSKRGRKTKIVHYLEDSSEDELKEDVDDDDDATNQVSEDNEDIEEDEDEDVKMEEDITSSIEVVKAENTNSTPFTRKQRGREREEDEEKKENDVLSPARGSTSVGTRSSKRLKSENSASKKNGDIRGFFFKSPTKSAEDKKKTGQVSKISKSSVSKANVKKETVTRKKTTTTKKKLSTASSSKKKRKKVESDSEDYVDDESDSDEDDDSDLFVESSDEDEEMDSFSEEEDSDFEVLRRQKVKKQTKRKTATTSKKAKAKSSTTKKAAAAASGKKKLSESFKPFSTPIYMDMSLKEIQESREFLDPCGMEATDDIIDKLIGEQVDTIGGLLLRSMENDGLGSDANILKLGTACSGTDAPSLALTLIQEQMELRGLGDKTMKTTKSSATSKDEEKKNKKRLEFTHQFSCEMDPFKQAYLARNFDSELYPDIAKLAASPPIDVYGQEMPLTPFNLFVAGTSCKNFSMLRSNKRIDIEDKGCSGETFLGACEVLFKEQPPLVVFENVQNAPWAKMSEYITGTFAYLFVRALFH
jgi:hypothetical protein